MQKEDRVLEILVGQQEALGNLTGKVNLVVEKLTEHDKEFEKINNRLDRHDSRFDRIEAAVLETNTKISKIEKNLDIAVTNHESRIRHLETIAHKQ